MKRLIPAVGYLRRSDEGQEASIPEQRAAIIEYAQQHGYEIVRWYTDDAISGDDTKNRVGFQQMIADATERKDFKAILVWNQARFGRFDSLELGFWVHPLRKAGVNLVTLEQGVIDWNDFAGRITYSMTQEGKHAQLIDLSRDVTRGQLNCAKSGSWIGSRPYGYVIVGERKHKRIVLDDITKVRIVQRIFREFVDELRSMREFAARLRVDNIPSPRGGRWRYDAVQSILENPAYTGDYVGGKYSYGKYHTVSGGEVTKSNGQRRCKPESEWIRHPDHHDAIIDRETFAKARGILNGRKRGNSPHKSEENPYLLNGVLRCGRCGAVLWGMEARKFTRYECSDAKYGRELARHDACEGTYVREDVILNDLADKLENWLGDCIDIDALGTAAYYGALSEADVPEVFSELKRLLTPPARPKADRKRIKKQVAKLEAEVAKLRRNVGYVNDPENIAAVEKEIREKIEMRDDLQRELTQTKPPTEMDINQIVCGVLHQLYSIANACRISRQPLDDGTEIVGSLEKYGPEAIRRFLRSVDHIDAYTGKRGNGNGTRHEFQRAELFLRVGGVTGNSNPHPPD